MHPLRTSRHLLQLVQKSALPKVSGRSSRSLARSTSPGASSNALRPCGLHTSSSCGPVGFAEQESHLRSPVSHQCGKPPGSRARSPTSRCRNRLLQRPAHLESKTRHSPACPLRRSCWRPVTRSHPLGSRIRAVLPPPRGAAQGLSWKVCRRSQAGLPWRPALLPRRPQTPRSAEDFCRLAATPVPKRLDRLFETTLRGPTVCAPVSGPLHPSRGHLQPSPGLLC